MQHTLGDPNATGFKILQSIQHGLMKILSAEWPELVGGLIRLRPHGIPLRGLWGTTDANGRTISIQVISIDSARAPA